MQHIHDIPFSGKAEDGKRWSSTFLAMATAKGHKEVIRPIHSPTEAYTGSGWGSCIDDEISIQGVRTVCGKIGHKGSNCFTLE